VSTLQVLLSYLPIGLGGLVAGVMAGSTPSSIEWRSTPSSRLGRRDGTRPLHLACEPIGDIQESRTSVVNLSSAGITQDLATETRVALIGIVMSRDAVPQRAIGCL
jgi:hypothetical protein